VTERSVAEALSSEDEALLVEIFYWRMPAYAEADVLRLARITPAALERAVAENEVEPRKTGADRLFAWEDVVSLALDHWTPRMISAAARAALPPLNRTCVIPVELPLYQIRFLRHLAMAASELGKPPLNVSDVLEREIDGLVSSASASDLASLEKQMPGFTAAALDFASFQQRPRLVAKEACVYCGSAPPAGSHACAACLLLHEPGTGDEERS